MAKPSRFKRLTVQSAVVFTLLAGAVVPYAYADQAQITASNELYNLPSVGSVYITDKSYFEIKEANLSVGSDQNVVNFRVKIYNGEASDLSLIDYWIKLQSTSGIKYTVNVAPQDKDKNTISPQSSQEIMFYAKVGPTVGLADLIFKIIKWDFSIPGFEKNLGEITYPADYNNVVPAYRKRNLQILKTAVTTSIKKATIASNQDNYLPTLLVELQNADTRSLKLPQLQFSIRTPDGLQYPLQTTNLTDKTTIDPLMKKEITLSGTIPKSISAEGWQLVVEQVADTGNTGAVNLTLGVFEVPKPVESELSTEKEQSFTSKDGTYIAKLETIERLPWEDQDLISVKLSLRTSEDRSLPIPNLSGYFKLDDNVKVDAKLIRLDNVIGLRSDKDVEVQLVGKIPYTYEFSDVTIVLQEAASTGGTTTPTGDTTGSELVQFKVSSTMDSVPLVKAGESIGIGGVGRSGEYQIHSIQTFQGKTSEVFAVQLSVQNSEKRMNDLSKLVAYFKTTDGTMIPAELSQIKNKIAPSNKALLNVSASFMKDGSNQVNQLIIGEALTDGKFTTGDGKPDSYVNAVSFAMPVENTTPINEIKNIEMFPYQLSLSKVGTSIKIGQASNNVKVSFNYDLQKQAGIEVNAQDYKIVFEMEDVKGLAKLSQVLDVETAAQAGSTTVLQLGTNSMEFNLTDTELIYKTQNLQKYKLNIYQQFKDHKKLIASKELDWFVYSD
ncbi:hypothetical protein [Paenibacillus sp. HJGM_3]|uniref:hypothetical protein n=1 Tax=Paenibacillus sp. HJGM_3 TaxID=3379816 RepID=UPI00385D2427